jgi:hypothetical protein
MLPLRGYVRIFKLSLDTSPDPNSPCHVTLGQRELAGVHNVAEGQLLRTLQISLNASRPAN